MKNNNIITMIIVAVVIAAIGFFGGMQYEKGKVATTARGQFAAGGDNARFGSGSGAGGPGGRFGGRGGAGATVGQIVSSDANSITVKLADGSSKIVNISGSTKISKSETATMSELTTGLQVAAFGTPNSDGSITAMTVQLNPQMMRLGGQGGPSQNASPSPAQSGY